MSSEESVEIIRLVKENDASQVEWEKAKNLDAKFMKQSLREDYFIPKSKYSNYTVFKVNIV